MIFTTNIAVFPLLVLEKRLHFAILEPFTGPLVSESLHLKDHYCQI